MTSNQLNSSSNCFFTMLPLELHYLIANYLSVKDIISVSKTCPDLQRKYWPMAWKNVLVDRRTSALNINPKDRLNIPITALYQKLDHIPYGWIESIEFGNPNNNFGIEALEIISKQTSLPYNKKLFPKLKKIIVNLNYLSSSQFLKNEWVRSLLFMEGKPGWPEVEIKHPDLWQLDYQAQISDPIDLIDNYKGNILEVYNRFISKTSLTQYATELLFSKYDKIICYSKLRSLSIIVDNSSNFSLAKILPSNTPNLEELEIIWEVNDLLNPNKNVPLAIVSLNKVNNNFNRKLCKCTLVIPQNKYQYSNEPREPTNEVIVNSPIVTHFVNKATSLNLLQFYRSFQFPNLDNVSLIVSDYQRNYQPGFMYSGWDKEKQWKFSTLELVVHPSSRLDTEEMRFYRQLIQSTHVKNLRLQLSSIFWTYSKPFTGIAYELPLWSRQKSSEIIKSSLIDNPCNDYDYPGFRKLMPVLLRLRKNNIITQYQFTEFIECQRNLAQDIMCVFSSSLPPLNFTQKNIENYLSLNSKKYCCESNRLPEGEDVFEKIIGLAGGSNGINYLNIDIIDYKLRSPSVELKKIIKNPSPNLKQVFTTFEILQCEKTREFWKNEIPIVPYVSYFYGNHKPNGRSQVGACYDLHRKVTYVDKFIKLSRRGNCTFAMDSMKQANRGFYGWI